MHAFGGQAIHLRSRIMGLAVIACYLAAASPVFSQSLERESRPAPGSIQEEVFIRLKSRPVGRHTLEVFDLPDDFLSRVADRIVRLTYQDRFRMVAQDTREPNSTRRAAGKADRPIQVVGTDRAQPPSSWPRYVAIGVVVAILVGASMTLRRRRRSS